MPRKTKVTEAQKAFLSMPAPAGSTGRKVAQTKAVPGSAQDAPARRQRKTKRAASFTPTMTGADLASPPKASSPTPKAKPRMRARGKLAVAAVVGSAAAGTAGLMGMRKKVAAPGETTARAERLHRLHDTLYKKKK